MRSTCMREVSMQVCYKRERPVCCVLTSCRSLREVSCSLCRWCRHMQLILSDGYSSRIDSAPLHSQRAKIHILTRSLKNQLDWRDESKGNAKLERSGKHTVNPSPLRWSGSVLLGCLVLAFRFESVGSTGEKSFKIWADVTGATVDKILPVSVFGPPFTSHF